MAEASVTPEASVVSPGKGIRYIGNYAYAYSGVVNVSNTEIDLLNFTSGSGFIVGEWFAHFNQLTGDGIATEDFRFILYLNSLQIAMMETSDSQGSSRNTIRNIIIPPFTSVTITARNYTGNLTEPIGAVLTGRVYGAE